jgi:hypothetical protein
MQQFLKPTARAAWAKVISSQLFHEFFVAMHDPQAASNVSL